MKLGPLNFSALINFRSKKATWTSRERPPRPQTLDSPKGSTQRFFHPVLVTQMEPNFEIQTIDDHCPNLFYYQRRISLRLTTVRLITVKG